MTTERIHRGTHDSRPADKPTLTPQDEALKGASVAWKPPVKPKPNINTNRIDKGALVEGTIIEKGPSRGAIQHERYTTPIKLDHTGDQMTPRQQNTGGRARIDSPRGDAARRSPSRTRMSRLDGGGFLHPSGPSAEQRQSPSFIAATLAASRSASISPNLTGQKLSGPDVGSRAGFTRSPSSRRSSSMESSDRVLDTTSIPPTTSLIGMFEQNARTQDKGRPPPTRKIIDEIPSTPPTKPVKAPSPRKLRTPSPSPLRTKSIPFTPRGVPPSNPSPEHVKATGNSFSPIVARDSILAPQPKPKPALEAQLPPKPPSKRKPIVPAVSSHGIGNESSSSNDSFVSARDQKQALPPRAHATTVPQHAHITSASATASTSFNTINSMADAIVASSLASSRAGSPAKQLLQAPPPPPSRRSPHGHLFHNHKEVSRTPSPSKQAAMRTTMRKPKLGVEEDEGDKRRSKKHIMKKHPNKHHEGDRKRWRDEITERERKRYEAVWASNKGLYIVQSFLGAENSVCSLVARDIFSRSRLNVDVLEEAYALVDRGQNGVLEKEEFVVGLWLIDQRLKGRKLPIRVSDHVWRSVGSLKGIKVRKAGK